MIPERIARAVAGLLVPVALLVMITGAPNLIGFVAVLAVAGLVVVVGRPRGETASADWSAVSRSEVSTMGPARGSVARSLGLIETRELLLSPWFQVGVGFCIVFLVAISSFEKSWWSTAELYPILVHPLCGLVIVAVHRNMTRAERDGTAELYETCPATESDRRRAHLFAGAAPLAVASSFVAVLVVGSAIVLDGIYGPMGERVVFNIVVAGVLLPIGAVALGIALARATRSTLAPIAAVGFVAIANILVVEEPDGLSWFATARVDQGSDVVFFDPPLLGRLLWIVGLVLATSALAIPFRRSLRPAVISAIVVVLVAGAFLNLRDLPQSTVVRLAGYAAASPDHTSCTDLVDGGTVAVCAPEPYEDHGRAMAETLRPVAAALPDQVLDETLVLGFPAADPDALQSQVSEHLEMSRTRFVVPLPFGHHRSNFGEARFKLAAIATGVFTGDDPENVLVDGQARGVALLWLATREMSSNDVDRLFQPYSRESASHAGHIWPGVCGAPIQWAPEDVAAARLVIASEEDEVHDVLDASWERWVDPSTRTDDLLAALGLVSQGPTSQIRPLGSIC